MCFSLSIYQPGEVLAIKGCILAGIRSARMLAHEEVERAGCIPDGLRRQYFIRFIEPIFADFFQCAAEVILVLGGFVPHKLSAHSADAVRPAFQRFAWVFASFWAAAAASKVGDKLQQDGGLRQART